MARSRVADALITSMYGFDLAPPALRLMPRRLLTAATDVGADVLLMGGDMKRPAFIRPAFDALARTLPHHRSVRFPGLDHGGSSDPSPTNRGGQPGAVAPDVLKFFGQR